MNYKEITFLEKQLFGIDFSGGKDAAKKIWITKARLRKKTIIIEEVYPIAKKQGNKDQLKNREDALKRLVNLLEEEKEIAIVGMDFPFSVNYNRKLKPSTWKAFVLKLATKYKNEDEFRAELFKLYNNKEEKRNTDIIAKSPFSPINRRMYKQTYYGITQVIVPLLISKKFLFLPFHKYQDHKSCIIEICPASFLKKHNKYKSYKGKKSDSEKKTRRAEIIEYLKKYYLKYSLEISPKYSQIIIDDAEGDALDSLLAVFCILEANQHKTKNDFEGHIYF